MLPPVPDLSFADLEIASPVEACWRLLCEVERVPAWVRGVARVVVIEVDGEGRPTLVEFLSMPNRGSVSYRLAYTYDAGARTVRWRSSSAEVRELAGEAVLEELVDGRTRLRYGVRAGAGDRVPSWAASALTDESPAALAEAFRRVAERSGAQKI
jgi:uncharacterized membrane protein